MNDIDNLILEKLESLEKRMDRLDDKIVRVKNSGKRLVSDSPSKDANSREYITEHILENFDFHRCARVMEFLEWTWANAENRIPTASEIRSLAENLFAQAWNDLDGRAFDESGWRDWIVATGGLEVCVYEGNESQGGKRLAALRFIVEEMSNE